MTLDDHCKLQYWLVQKLKTNGYTRIYQNMEYRVKLHHHEYIGEVDVLAMSPKGRWHFYEIKTSHHKYDYACSQYKRFLAAHPFCDARGIFISLKNIRFLQR